MPTSPLPFREEQRPRRLGAIAGACVLALAAGALAACNNSGGGSSAAGDVSYEDSPLYAYWSMFDTMGDMTPQEQQAFYDEQTRAQEELIAQCMADQGFEFNAEGSAGYTMVGGEAAEDDGPAWGTVEYAEQYGYGAFTWYGEEDQGMGEVEEWTDPNADVIAAMSESELTAWYEALYGGSTEQEWDPDADMEEYEWNWEDGGCTGWAQHESEQNNPQTQLWSLMEDPRFADLFEQMNAVYEQSLTDPRTVELNAQWSSCMADAGFTFTDPNAAQQSFFDKANSVWDDHDGSESWEPDPAMMQQNKDDELATAVADFTCQEKLGYQDEMLEIQFDLEQKFVDENKAALDEFAAAAQELQQ